MEEVMLPSTKFRLRSLARQRDPGSSAIVENSSDDQSFWRPGSDDKLW
jgi:hypothetical protein